MAVVRLPVLDDPRRPRTVGDCRGMPRPCPWVSCRFNLLTDVLDDGTIVLNAPSKRLTGAERTIQPKHDVEQQWYVEVRLVQGASERANEEARRRAEERVVEAREAARQHRERVVAEARERARRVDRGETPASRQRAKDRVHRMIARARAAADRKADRILARAEVDRDMDRAKIFVLGPLGSAPRAQEVADAWEAIAGPNTTRSHRYLPDRYKPAGTLHEGSVDAKFRDELEDAVEHWFDDPDPNMPSCVLDEVNKVDRDDDEHLLEQIARVMHVSRERVRQVEATAIAKLQAAGLTIADVLDED